MTLRMISKLTFKTGDFREGGSKEDFEEFLRGLHEGFKEDFEWSLEGAYKLPVYVITLF